VFFVLCLHAQGVLVWRAGFPRNRSVHAHWNMVWNQTPQPAKVPRLGAPGQPPSGRQQNVHMQQHFGEEMWNANSQEVPEWPDEAWGQAEESVPHPPAGRPPPRGGVQAKAEVTGAPAGETERERKIRERAVKMRGEAQQVTQENETRSKEAEEKKLAVAAEEQKSQEGDDQAKLEQMRRPLEDKVRQVEDEAEKAAVLAAPLSMEVSEDLRALQMGAIRDTERAVKSGLASLSEVQREVTAKLAVVSAFVGAAKVAGEKELGNFQARLDAAKERLNENKNVRNDHEAALVAEKNFGELAQRLAGVEIDCEKAAMMAEPLARTLEHDPRAISAAEIRETKEALRVAAAHLAPTMRLIQSKSVGLKGGTAKKMHGLQSRCENCQNVVDRAQRTCEEAQSAATAGPIVEQAMERLAMVEEELDKMRETETPFLMGVENMPAQDAYEALDKMEKAAALVYTTNADALKFVALKTVEIGRLAEGAAASSRAEMDKVRQILEERMVAVRKFQDSTSKRKRGNLVDVIKDKVTDAEALVAKMSEVGAALSQTAPADYAEALEKARGCELEAQNAVTCARRELHEKQEEMGPLGGATPEQAKSSSEILRTKVRVSHMEADVTKFKRTIKDFEEKIRISASLGEVHDEHAAIDTEVERLVLASQTWPVDELPPEDEEKCTLEVQSRLGKLNVQIQGRARQTQAQGGAQSLELRELRMLLASLQKSQHKLDGVKSIARERSRSQSQKLVQEGTDAVQRAEQKIQAIQTATSNATTMKNVLKLEELNSNASQAVELVEKAQKAVAAGHQSPLMLESKVEFARLQLRVKAAERKARSVCETVAKRFEATAADAMSLVLDMLRRAARSSDGTCEGDELFNELSDGKDQVTEEQFQDYFLKDPCGLTDDKIQVAYRRMAPHGLSRRAFTAKLTDYRICVREITLTDSVEIQKAKRLRKVEVGEVLEALGASQVDEVLGLERLRIRAICDGVIGWVTLKSNAGTIYLEKTEKPFLWCQETVFLRNEGTEDSATVRELKPGEVLELIQGPREERLSSDMRVRGVSCQEDTSGWLQIRDRKGNVLAQLNKKIHKCHEAIAMTDVADFENCNMIRRIESGEALELLTDPEVIPPEGGKRCRFRACKDGREGWVTSLGKNGTQYVRPAQKHYSCIQAAPLHLGLGSESSVSRVLMPGEAFAGFEDPKEVSDGEKRIIYLARAVADGAEGWVTSGPAGEVGPLAKQYMVERSVPLTTSLAANEAAQTSDVVRHLDVGEEVDMTDQPVIDTSTNHLRAHIVAARDKATGWATVREVNSIFLWLRPAADMSDAAQAIGGDAAPSTPPATSGGKGQGVKRGAGPPGGSASQNQQVKDEDGAPERPWQKSSGKGTGSDRRGEPPQKFHKGDKGKGTGKGKSKSKGKW